ncbi:MAG: M6 family metalloprotease domain-containing protein [Muribaculaceae bacterium]|nr:M6 family metalloprotease domain-containing protein [Muribaculaceae bacterium]
MKIINFKKFLCVCLFVVAGVLTTFAIPAHPRPVDVTQSDGSRLTVRLVGDEFYHRTMTTDGYTLLQRSNGDYVYAVESASKLIPSDVIAHNPMMRNTGELKMLSKLQKGLTDKTMAAQGKSMHASRDQLNATTRTDYKDFRGLLILINYNDRTFTYGNDYFNDMMNLKDYMGFYREDGSFVPCTGSARDYYYENSMGLFEPHFDVVGPVTVNYSCTDPHGTSWTVGNIFVAAVDSLDNSIDFSRYDGDGDGEVDMIYFVVAGYTSNFGGNNSGYLWPHQYYMYYFTSQQYDGVYLGRYSCSGEIYGWENYGFTDPDGIGTICHEFTHALGLMDLYDTNYEQEGEANDPGDWDIMAGGCYMNDSRTPVGFSLWERYRLGFADPEEITEKRAGYFLLPLNTSNTGYWLPSPNENEIFMLENRQNTRWDAYLPGHGMLITRIEYYRSRWASNTINTNASHMYYEILRAGNGFGSNPNDPFPGTDQVREINNLTTPNLMTWDGQVNEFGLNNISEKDAIVTFGVVNGDGTTPGHGFELGDVNHDQSVSIADVTALIDYLLDASQEICTVCADVNGNGELTIGDVTALIDLLLGIR